MKETDVERIGLWKEEENTLYKGLRMNLDSEIRAYDWDHDGDLPMLEAKRLANGAYKLVTPRTNYNVRSAWLGPRVRVNVRGRGTCVAVAIDDVLPGCTIDTVMLWPPAFDDVPRSILDDTIRPRLRALACLGVTPRQATPRL